MIPVEVEEIGVILIRNKDITLLHVSWVSYSIYFRDKELYQPLINAILNSAKGKKFKIQSSLIVVTLSLVLF